MYISFPLIFHFRIKSLFNIKFCILSLASRRKLFFNVTYHSVAEFLHCNKIQNLLQSLSPSGSNYCLQGQNLVQTKAEDLLHIKVAFLFLYHNTAIFHLPILADPTPRFKTIIYPELHGPTSTNSLNTSLNSRFEVISGVKMFGGSAETKPSQVFFEDKIKQMNLGCCYGCKSMEKQGHP